MILRTLALLAFIVIQPLEVRGQELTTRDHILRATSTALILADWSLTMDGIDKGLSESNPFLGEHPSKGRVNTLVGATVLLNAFLVPKLKDEDLRTFIWLAVIVVEIDACRVNRQSGLSFSLRF